MMIPAIEARTLRACAVLSSDCALFPVRDAWWFVPAAVSQAAGRPTAGSDDYTAPNPPHGALMTYWLKEAPTTAREARRAAEKTLRDAGRDVPFPGFERLREELNERGPQLFLVVSDASGRAVRRIEAPATAGVHRVNWDLRGPAPDPVDLSAPGFRPPWANQPRGPLVAPGRYTAELLMVSGSGARRIGEPRSFTVKPAPNALVGTDYAAVTAFQEEASELMRQAGAVGAELERTRDRMRHMRAAFAAAPRATPALRARMDSTDRRLADLADRKSVV